jgi:hypothetical protein
MIISGSGAEGRRMRRAAGDAGDDLLGDLAELDVAASRVAIPTATTASWVKRPASRVCASPKKRGRPEYRMSAPTGRS